MTTDKQIAMKELTLVRDCVINALLLCNAARSGAVTNMTVLTLLLPGGTKCPQRRLSYAVLSVQEIQI